MKKADLIAKIAENTDMPKKTCEAVFDETFKVFAEQLAAGESVTIPNFGKLEVRERKARTGRNPQTGAEMQIPAAKSVALKAGKVLKEAVNK